MRPELAVKHKVKALERKKALLDALITYLGKNPNVAAETTLKALSGRAVLYFYDAAVIRPVWVKDRVVLRLEKHTEDWSYLEDSPDPFDASHRTVVEDVSEMPEDELFEIINKLDEELHPDEKDDA